MSTFTEREFRSAMGQFCSGVVIVTGLCEGMPVGFSAQSFVSLSLQPPLIGVCPARTSSSWPRIRASGSFGINVLGIDQKELCASFARSGGDKFARRNWSNGLTGSPMLEGALSFIDCRLEAEHEAGDHSIAVGRVVDLKVLDTERLPLLFFRGLYGAFDVLRATEPAGD
ncbi:MAG: flavin reductase family protein [Panacagrimonas sp.]